ncbi:MAG: hypothetical protein ACNA7M_00370 [Roseovarius sp.]
MRAIRHYQQGYRVGFLAAITKDRSPREAILAIFDAIAQGNDTMPGGCLVVSSAMELAYMMLKSPASSQTAWLRSKMCLPVASQQSDDRVRTLLN